jgi:hypothetical protein
MVVLVVLWVPCCECSWCGAVLVVRIPPGVFRRSGNAVV